VVIIAPGCSVREHRVLWYNDSDAAIDQERTWVAITYTQNTLLLNKPCMELSRHPPDLLNPPPKFDQVGVVTENSFPGPTSGPLTIVARAIKCGSPFPSPVWRRILGHSPLLHSNLVARMSVERRGRPFQQGVNTTGQSTKAIMNVAATRRFYSWPSNAENSEFRN
jgi:hypothetical protein